MQRPYFSISGNVPPISDHSWLSKTRPLLTYLDQARTWKELRTLTKFTGSLLRNSLAWLEHHGEAKSYIREDVVYWVRVPGLWANETVNKRNPVIPKAPQVPSIPGFEPLDEPRDTIPPDTDREPLHPDTIPTGDPVFETEGQVNDEPAVPTIPSPQD